VIDLVAKVSGRRPPDTSRRGGKFSPVTNELLLKKGHQVRPQPDAQGFRALLRARGDRWTLIDYSRSRRNG